MEPRSKRRKGNRGLAGRVGNGREGVLTRTRQMEQDGWGPVPQKTSENNPSADYQGVCSGWTRGKTTMMPAEFPSLGPGTGLIKGNSMNEGGRPRSLVSASFPGRERKESPSDAGAILYRSEPSAVLASSDRYACISAIPGHRRRKGCRDTFQASVRGDGTPCQQYNIGPSGCTPGGPNPESRAKERTGDAWGRAGSRYLPRTGVLLFIVFTEGSQTSSVYYKWPGLLWQFCDWAFGSRRPNRLKLKPQNVPVYALSISLASSVGEMLAAWPAIDLFRPDPKVAITATLRKVMFLKFGREEVRSYNRIPSVLIRPKTILLPMGNRKITRLFETIMNLNNLLMVYECIESDLGDLTHDPGLDKTTLDGLHLMELERRSMKLDQGTFFFPHMGILFVPRHPSKRPIQIPPPRDQILDKSMALALEDSFHLLFPDDSIHSFRMGEGHHTLSRNLEDNWQAAGYGKGKTERSIGIPRGTVASPILINIFLHVLDAFVQHHLCDILFREEGGKYVRYCDHLLFGLNKPSMAFAEHVDRRLKDFAGEVLGITLRTEIVIAPASTIFLGIKLTLPQSPEEKIRLEAPVLIERLFRIQILSPSGNSTNWGSFGYTENEIELVKRELKLGLYFQIARLQRISPLDVPELYGEDLEKLVNSGRIRTPYITSREIQEIGSQFLEKEKRGRCILTKMSNDSCAVFGCGGKGVGVHPVENVKDYFGFLGDIILGEGDHSFQTGMDASRWREQIPLCVEHQKKMHDGELELLDLSMMPIIGGFQVVARNTYNKYAEGALERNGFLIRLPAR
eukprot:Gb_35178 [translate_table: standard]